MMQKLADQATEEAAKVLAHPLSDEEKKALNKIIEHAVVEAMRITVQECHDAATGCFDESHHQKKITIELNKRETVLMADMGSMR